MIEKAQAFLREHKLDGWLLYDFHGKNNLARRILGLKPEMMTTRRFFYWIPQEGSPIQLVHAIEANVLEALPGQKRVYSSWQSIEKELRNILQKSKKVAMEYSFKNAIPYVSLVDGGTIDLIRSFGIEVVSSADFSPYFTAVLSKEQIESQKRASLALDSIVKEMWSLVGKKAGRISEYELQQEIVKEFHQKGFVFDHDPIVAVNAHSADPHFEPQKEGSSLIQKGDFLLIDLWAKEKNGIYADFTKVAVLGDRPREKQAKIFHIVRQAQKKAIELVRQRFAQEKRLEGWEVDEAAREVIREAGFENFFTHRTGHSIEEDLHGSGAHMDNLEMHDVRPLLKGTCFSIEPGIYLPGEFGVRLEVDVIVNLDGSVKVSGQEQDEIFCIR